MQIDVLALVQGWIFVHTKFAELPSFVQSELRVR
jgi:hypothetical protein